MRLAITYSIIPSFGESSSLHVQIDSEESSSKFWVQFGGLGHDFINDKPWWVDYEKPALEPELIDSSYTKKLVGALRSISVEPYSEFSVGCDGTTFELELLAGFNRSKFVWWGDLPSQWQRLEPLIEYLQNIVAGKHSSA